MSESKRVSLRLTPEQQAELKQTLGLDGGEIQLTLEELEERIAPSRFIRLAGDAGEASDALHEGWIDVIE